MTHPTRSILVSRTCDCCMCHRSNFFFQSLELGSLGVGEGVSKKGPYSTSFLHKPGERSYFLPTTPKAHGKRENSQVSTLAGGVRGAGERSSSSSTSSTTRITTTTTHHHHNSEDSRVDAEGEWRKSDCPERGYWQTYWQEAHRSQARRKESRQVPT